MNEPVACPPSSNNTLSRYQVRGPKAGAAVTLPEGTLMIESPVAYWQVGFKHTPSYEPVSSGRVPPPLASVPRNPHCSMPETPGMGLGVVQKITTAGRPMGLCTV